MNDSTLNNPLISVIVCHHTGDLLIGFIESIKKSHGAFFEVIVMTSDEKLAVTGIPDCWVHHSIEMPAAKRNAGARLARGKYLAFFDDDVEVDPDCLFNLLWSFANPGVGMVYGKLWNMERRNRFDEAGGYLTGTGFIWSRAGQNDIDMGQFDWHDGAPNEPILAGKSASCMVLKKVFDQAGGFDEDFGILGEETDLSWRIWLKGYRVVFNSGATGYHAFNTKFKPPEKYYTSSRVHFNGCRNYITMLIKNLEAKNLWRILPVHLSIWFFAGVAMLITGKIAQGMNILKALGWCLTKTGSILSKRRKIQERRNVTDDELWTLIFKAPPRGYCWRRFTRYLRIGLHG